MEKTNVVCASQEEFARENIFLFPDGIIGFPDAKHFALIYQGYGDVACLQCVDSYEPALLVTPWDCDRLGALPAGEVLPEVISNKSSKDMLWLVVLNPNADARWVTANIRAPIVIDEKTGNGLQFILPDESLPVRMKWIELSPE